MKTAIDLPDHPAITIRTGERIRADVTIDCEGEIISVPDTVIDFAPGVLHVHVQRDRIRAVYEFHLFRHGSVSLLFASWLAATLDRSLPLLHPHLRIESNALLVDPPWPLDFFIRTDGLELDAARRIMETFRVVDRPTPHAR